MPWLHTGPVDSPSPAQTHIVTGWSGTAVHAARPPTNVPRLIAVAFAGAALAAAVALGAAACIAGGGPTGSTPTSAKLMTVPSQPLPPDSRG